MKELKVVVERCVRPVIREESAKLRMREELYDHVLAAYQHELESSNNDSQLALERTFKRMGDPKLLTAELQDSIGVLDRWTGHIDAYLHRSHKMTLWRYACRFTYYFGTILFCELLLLLGLRWLGVLPKGDWSFAEFRFIGSFFFIAILNLFVFSLLYGKVFGYFERAKWTIRNVVSVVGLVLSAVIEMLVTGWMFIYLATGSVDFTRQALPYWAALGIVAGLAMVLVSWLGCSQLRGLKEWRELEIDS